MLKKEEVFVRVSSEKKARKLAKLLDMFGEKETHPQVSINSALEHGEFICYTTQYTVGWCWTDESTLISRNLKEVSLKELRNILAKKHLKEGDVVLTKNGNDKIIAVVNKTCNSNVALFESKKWIRLHDGFKWNNKGCFDYFIRYATEEEKALLEPKKELEVGRWYKSWNDTYNDYDYSFHTGTGTDYGFHAENNNWFDEQFWIKNTKENEWTEATPEEVEEALIKEANRRYKVGDKLSKFQDDYSKGDRIFSLNLSHQAGLCDLWIDDDNGYSSCIFKNGKWAEVIKPEKSLEERVKELEERVKELESM